MSDFMVMAKPAGSRCNMACSYCYYLDKGKYSMHGTQTVMSDPVLDKMIRQIIKGSSGQAVSIVWHGGEPTLAGIDFYKKAVALEKKYLPRGRQMWNNLQTNGLLINEEWCRFLKQEGFDCGVSIDGTKEIHDTNRRLAGGQPTYDKVAAGISLLNRYGVPTDLLCTVNSRTVTDPEGVYEALKALGTGWMQFIPIVVRRNAGSPVPEDAAPVSPGTAAAGKTAAGETPAVLNDPAASRNSEDAAGTGYACSLSPQSVTPEQYGEFLVRVFDRWRADGDVGKIHIQLFDETARAWKGMRPSVCWMQETCGRALIVEEDGAVYACDHFVDPDHRLGTVRDNTLAELADSPRQKAWGESKKTALCEECRACPWLSACGGGCLKDRIPDGKGRLRYFLCEGLKMFFEHAHDAMKK